MKTLVIFDIDGTLLHSNKVDSRSFGETWMQIYKTPMPNLDWHDYAHVTDTCIFETMFKKHYDKLPTAEAIQIFQLQFKERLQQNRLANPSDFMEVPGALSLFKKLISQKDKIIGIGTGGWKMHAQLKLRHIGIEPEGLPAAYADGNYTREDILQSSIDQAKTKGDFDRIVYVGDAIWDVQTTRAMQLNFIGLRIEGDYEVLKKEGAQHVLSNYLEEELFFDYLEKAVVPIA